MTNTRRDFLKKSAIGATGIAIAGTSTAKAYSGIKDANEKIVFGITGLHNRGKAHLKAIAALENTEVGFVCDVDSRVLEESVKLVKEATGKTPKAFVDYRKMLEEKDLDVVTIATPEHWHAPMAIMGAQAGKHVYIEKPASHNPAEGEMLVKVQKKTGMLIQMGNQQRSAPTSIQAIKDIRNGIIGDAYYAKAWYSNQRGSIGKGQVVPVPDWLNWDLWQGPAPRRDYQDNLVHYNWHWFKHWGTGEIHNNATHEIDICRWALDVEIPNKVTSSGGRFHYDDDWQFYDTQDASYEYAGGKMITWEGRSCNRFPHYGRGRGVTIHGTNGTILLDRNDYILYDKKNKVVKEMNEAGFSETTDTSGIGTLDVYHMQNMLDAIRKGAKLAAPINEGRISTLLCHLGNISQEVGRTLYVDSKNGHIIGDGQAMQLWSREYEPGWEPKV